jgi:hypothetical protein
MKIALNEQLTLLVERVTANVVGRGNAIVLGAESASRLEILWLQYLLSTQLTGTADSLLHGALSAIREGASCIALGLVRPALSSLRLQIDLSLGWLYFKDHPVEWARVQDTGDGFKMKQDLLKYLGESYPGYGTRFGILLNCATRTQPDPYRLLSAHLHGQSEHVLPQVNMPSDIVAPVAMQDESLLLQCECSEFINDVFWAAFMTRWQSITTALTDNLETRFKSAEQRAAFFKS